MTPSHLQLSKIAGNSSPSSHGMDVEEEKALEEEKEGEYSPLLNKRITRSVAAANKSESPVARKIKFYDKIIYPNTVSDDTSVDRSTSSFDVTRTGNDENVITVTENKNGNNGNQMKIPASKEQEERKDYSTVALAVFLTGATATARYYIPGAIGNGTQELTESNPTVYYRIWEVLNAFALYIGIIVTIIQAAVYAFTCLPLTYRNMVQLGLFWSNFLGLVMMTTGLFVLYLGDVKVEDKFSAKLTVAGTFIVGIPILIFLLVSLCVREDV